MLTTRILPILLVVVLAVVSVGYLSDAIDGSDRGNLPPLPVTNQTPVPEATASPTPVLTSTWDTIPIAPQIDEIVTFSPTALATPAMTSAPGENETAYYVHMDDTMKYNTSTSRMFNLHVDQVPFMVYFSFNPGMVKKSYLSKDATSSQTTQYEVWNPTTGKYESRSEVGSRYTVKTTDVIDPNAWFRIEIIRIYDDPDAYAAAVSAAGGKEKLASSHLLYEDNGIVVRQDGYSRGFSSEVEKELKLLSTGHYILKVTGNQIVANIQMLSP